MQLHLGDNLNKIASRLEILFRHSAHERRQRYREVFGTEAGKEVLAELMRGSGILEVDKNPSLEDSIRVLSRWWPVANILNGMEMTDVEIITWSREAAAERAKAIGNRLDNEE